MLLAPSGKGRKRQKKGEKGRFRPISGKGGQTALEPPFVTPPFAAAQPRASGPEVPKSLEKVSKMSVRDFFETFARLFGTLGPEAPGDFFQTFLGSRALRETPVARGRVRNAWSIFTCPGKRKTYTALLQRRTFLCRKKWGPQRKDFGGGYGLPGFLQGFCIHHRPGKFFFEARKVPKRFSFGGGRVCFFSSLHVLFSHVCSSRVKFA